MNYEKDITIEETALDVEWLEQPALMLKYARHAAEMQKELDYAKEDLDLAKSELDKAIRSNPDKYEIEKITETVVQNTIISQDRYIEANHKLIEVQFELNVAKGAARAIDARTNSLENLVQLHGQQYFAGPKMPRDLSAEVEKREKQNQANMKVASAMKRTK